MVYSVNLSVEGREAVHCRWSGRHRLAVDDLIPLPFDERGGATGERRLPVWRVTSLKPHWHDDVEANVIVEYSGA